MMVLNIFFVVLLFITLLIFKFSKHFFKALFTSVIGGVGALCSVCAFSYFVPLTIGINWLTLSVSAMFSVPGVIMILLLNTFVL